MTSYKGKDYLILIPSSLIIGVAGGLYGPLFININFRTNAWRKKYINKNWKKVVEAGFFCFMSATIFYIIPYLEGQCTDFQSSSSSDDDLLQKEAWCIQDPTKEDFISYNPLATISWSSEGEIIRNLMKSHFEINLGSLTVFMLCWMILTAVTYGVNLPAGLFLPGMVIGSAFGELFARFLNQQGYIEENELNDVRKHFVVLGCSSFLAGYTRMTYSLAVIMMETSQSISIFIPIIFTIVVSNQVGYAFTRSLYQRACRGK